MYVPVSTYPSVSLSQNNVGCGSDPEQSLVCMVSMRSGVLDWGIQVPATQLEPVGFCSSQIFTRLSILDVCSMLLSVAYEPSPQVYGTGRDDGTQCGYCMGLCGLAAALGYVHSVVV